jgi:hypothetical protein
MGKIIRGIMGVLLAAGLSSAAMAGDMMVKGQFGWLGVGAAHELEKGHYYWVGEFSGTFFNDAGPGNAMHNSGVKCPGYNDLDFNNKKSTAAGHCIVMDRDGDKAMASWQCVGDTYKCNGTITWTSGTGKYAKISGSMPFTGVTEVSHTDGKASGWATWNR